MKCFKTWVPFGALALSFISPFAHASEGGSVRGGGSVLWLNDKWQMRDVLEASRPGAAPMRLAPPLERAILGSVKPMVEAYTGLFDSTYWDQVLGPTVDYRLVDALPAECAPDGGKLAPNESNFGCTSRGVTYLVREVFLALDNLNKALAILHERAHAQDPSNDAHARWIRPFIAGIEVGLRISYEQEQGKFRNLDAWEVQALELLAKDLEIRKALLPGAHGAPFGGVRSIVVQGGGVLVSDRFIHGWQVPIDATSFLGIGSTFEFSSARCHYKDTDPSAWPSLRDHTRVIFSNIFCAFITHSTIKDSDLDRVPRIAKKKFRITTIWSETTRKYEGPYQRYEPNRISDSLITGTVLKSFEDFVIRQSRISGSNLNFYSANTGRFDRATLENVRVTKPFAQIEAGWAMNVHMWTGVRVEVIGRKVSGDPKHASEIYTWQRSGVEIDDGGPPLN